MGDDGIERLRRWQDEQRGVPPAFGRLRARFDEVRPGRTSVRLPLHPELLLPDGSPTSALTALAADFGLTTCVIASLPDLRGVTTISMTVDHLTVPLPAGALVSHCTASTYHDGRPQHASGVLRDQSGREVAAVSGWFLATPAESGAAERVGLVEEPPADHLLALLDTAGGADFDLHARDALSNALGTLHGGVGALATQLAAEAARAPGLRTLASTFTYLRPTPRDGRVRVRGQVVRQGRRTALSTATLADDGGHTLLSASIVAG